MEKCLREFTYFLHENSPFKSAEFYFLGLAYPERRMCALKRMLLYKEFEPILLLHKQLRFACKKNYESLIKGAEIPILLVMPHIGLNFTQIHCNPLQGLTG